MNRDDIKALKAPFNADEIKWRVGSTTQDKKKGLALAYIDARCVFERLDMVVGPEGWQTWIKETASGRVLCTLLIDGIEKTDGAGDTGKEAEKGAISDAIKRAAVQWGIGRYLYNLPAVWCKIVPMGKSYRLAETPDLPAWATPNNVEVKGKKEITPESAESKSVLKRKKIQEEPDPDAFALACAKKVKEGRLFFESIGHAPEDAELSMNERLTDLLTGMRAAVGTSYVSYHEIEIREHQESFYRSLAGTVAAMIAEMDDE